MALGIQSKIEPDLDKSSTNRMVRDLEQQISQVEELNFRSGGFEGRTTPGGGGGRGMGGGGFGTAAGAGAAARGSGLSLGGLAKGAGVIGAVALAGTLANGMYRAMQNASGSLQATNSIFSTALDMYFKPYGDFLGDLFRPMAKSLLKATSGGAFSIAQDGWFVGGFKNLMNLINNLPGELGKVFVNMMGQSMEGLFGENDMFTAMQNFQWSDWIPIFKWNDFVDMFNWSDWVNPLRWDDQIGGIDWDNHIPRVKWGNIIPNFSWSQFIGGNGNGGQNTGTNTRDDVLGGTPNTSGSVSPSPGRGDSGPWGGWFEPGSNPWTGGGGGDIAVQLEADGRRLWDTAERNANDILDRI